MQEATRDVFTRPCIAVPSPAQAFELHGVIEMLRLKASGTSNRQIAMSCDVSSPQRHRVSALRGACLVILSATG